MALPQLSGFRFNKATLIIITVATALNIASHVAERHHWLNGDDANDIEVWKDQVIILVMGQTHKAIRKDMTRATDPAGVPKPPDGGAGG